MPTTSIIIATHNRPHLLPNAVASAQKAGSDVEVVVVDDASTDDTASVCERLENVKYVRLDRNQGVAGARNVGIMVSKGNFVSFLDDDDIRLPNTIDLQIQTLNSNPEAALVYGQAFVGHAQDVHYPSSCPRGNLFWELVKQNFIPCGTVVIRRSSLLSVDLLDQAIPGVDDWDLWVRIADVYPIDAIAQPVMIWRPSTPESNQGTSNATRIVNLATAQFNKWMELPTASRALERQKRSARISFSRNLASHLVWDARRAWAVKKHRQALSDLYNAARLHPRGLIKLSREHSAMQFIRSDPTRFGMSGTN